MRVPFRVLLKRGEILVSMDHACVLIPFLPFLPYGLYGCSMDSTRKEKYFFFKIVKFRMAIWYIWVYGYPHSKIYLKISSNMFDPSIL